MFKKYVIDSVIDYFKYYKLEHDEELNKLRNRVKHLEEGINIVKKNHDLLECEDCGLWIDMYTNNDYDQCYDCEVKKGKAICQECAKTSKHSSPDQWYIDGRHWMWMCRDCLEELLHKRKLDYRNN